MIFKDISYLELWQPSCSAKQNHLCNFGRGYHEEQFCEIILNLDQWFRRRSRLKDFLYRALAPSSSVKRNHLCNFGREHYGEHLCEIIFKLDQWFKRCQLRTTDNGHRPITIAHLEPSVM